MLGRILPTKSTSVVITNGNSILEVSDRDNGHQSSSLNETSATRAFAHGGKAVPRVTDPTQERIRSQISQLEEIEKALAAKYAMTGKIDSVAVRQEAQARAINASSEWKQMHELYHLRKNLMRIQINGSIEPESLPLASQSPSRVNDSRFWAVLIGIDAYPSRPLRGCVSDARKMAEYLIHDLGVPEDHIRQLLSINSYPQPPQDDNSVGSTDGFAQCYAGVDSRGIFTKNSSSIPTRANIIDTLLDLSTNPKIRHGDNIIIYFAGYGSSYELSDFYEAGDISAEGYIEALCPVDRTASSTDTSIPDISDREINIILAEISRSKGNHITFILDCCYSSGASRDPSTPLNVARFAPSLPATSVKDMLEAADTRLGKLPKYHSVFERNWEPDMTSHVVLVACEETQYAEEAEGADNRWNGIFTQALIRALKSDHLKEESTYVDLIRASKMPPNARQRPVVSGNLRARLWYQPEMGNIVSLQSGIGHAFVIKVKHPAVWAYMGAMFLQSQVTYK